jgi:hypothetical protein
MHYEQHSADSGPKGYEPDCMPSLLAGVVHAVQAQQPALILKDQSSQFERNTAVFALVLAFFRSSHS